MNVAQVEVVSYKPASDLLQRPVQQVYVGRILEVAPTPGNSAGVTENDIRAGVFA